MRSTCPAMLVGFFLLGAITVRATAQEHKNVLSIESAVEFAKGNGGGTGAMSPFELQVHYRLEPLRYERTRYTFQPEHAEVWRALMNDKKAELLTRLCAAQFLAEVDAEARQFLERHLQSDDLRIRYNAAEAVRIHMAHDRKKDWAVQTLAGLLEKGALDDRDEYTPIDRICYDFGFMKETKAIDALIKVLQRRPNTGSAAFALGEIGDQRAIPVLMKALRANTDDQQRVITALGELKSKEALPVLIERLGERPQDLFETESTLVALRDIGDKSAIEPIERYIAGDNPDDRKAVARRVLAQLKDDDPVASLLKLLETETYEPERSDIIDDLCRYKDERVIARLAKMARHSPSAFMRREAIYGLGRMEMKETLLPLAELLDAEFPSRLKAEWGWKGLPHFPMYFPDLIASQLKRRTGKDFGTDARAWKAFLTGEEIPAPPPVEPLPDIKDDATFELRDVLDFKRRDVSRFAFSPTARRLYVSHGDEGDDDRLYQWDLNTNKLEHVYRLGPGFMADEVAPSPDGRHVVVGCWPHEGTTCKTLIIDAGEKRIVHNLHRTDRIFDIEFNRDGSRFRLFTSEVRPGSDGVVYSTDGKRIEKPDLKEFKTPPDERVWRVSGSGGLWCRDRRGKERLLTDNGWHNNYGVTADGKFVATTTWDGELIVWRIADARQVFHTKHARAYGYLAYDAKANRFLLADTSHDGTTKLRALVVSSPKP